ncbi:unnamed protein product [Allacma fusca]|uniref:Uncharacterized protein n=1 Tax=Allacma fusca TaxID=39272 RepID=A0A8J2KVG2_9HEXA|nr:unnamed protein product [Allacma fusca]
MAKATYLLVVICGFYVSIEAENVLLPKLRSKRCSFNHKFESVGNYAFLVSPDYPNNYPSNKMCNYKFSSPEGTQMKLSCKDFNLQPSFNCQDDRFSVSTVGDENNVVVHCDQTQFEVQTQNNLLLAWFQSRFVEASEEHPYRFKCTITVVKPDDFTDPGGRPQTVEQGDNTCSCGKRNWEGVGVNHKIVGGVSALMGEFPWRCSLYAKNMGIFCGCTIIDNQWILTAAHCTNAVSPNEQLYVNVGDYDLTTTSETSNTVIRVVQIIQNERYSSDNQDFDVSLLRLEHPVQYNEMVQPVCLPWQFRSKSFHGAMVTASGWGTTTEGGQQADILQTVDLPVLTTQECQKYYGSRITDNMICTYQPGKDTCQGDSGSSVDYYDPITTRYYAVGVVSWGLGCAEKNDPGVYTKVTHFLDWIQANTQVEFCRPRQRHQRVRGKK